MQQHLPTLPAGTRVQHLGSPQYVGTVESSRVMAHGWDPCHVELIVRWDEAPGIRLYRSRCGIQSVQVLDGRGV